MANRLKTSLMEYDNLRGDREWFKKYGFPEGLTLEQKVEFLMGVINDLSRELQNQIRR